MIEVQDLVKAYGPRVAVDRVSFKVNKGEILGFLGPNGAGKTTTMRVLTGFLPATAGTAKVAGYDIFEESLESRKHIGYLPENVPLYLDLSVEDYLSYMGRLKGLTKTALKGRLDTVMESCGVAHRRRDLIGKLSRGYRQRVGLAQALIHDPDVLILDEPTASLDPNQIRDVREYIKSLAGNHTIILSTHILPEVELVCSRVVVINRGRIIADDTPENLRHVGLGGKHETTIEARGDQANLLRTIKAVSGVEGARIESLNDGMHRVHVDSTGEVSEDLARAVVNGGFGLRTLRVADQSLEDVFVRLTTEETAETEAA
jgi:ABC-2 type transport system ATP-binding protein